MRHHALVCAALLACVYTPTALGLDYSTIETLLKDVSDSPCRIELLALGMSFVNAHGCVSSVTAWDEMSRCNDKVFDFLETGGEILKKEKCADPLAELINKKVVDIDMKPIFKIFTDLYDCAQSQKDLSACRDQAVPALMKAGAQFANELLEGLSPSTESLAVAAMEAQVALGTCMRNAPKLDAELSADEFAAFKTSAQPLMDLVNEFRAAPLKRLLDEKQQWVFDRLLELLDEGTPMSVQTSRGLTVEDLKDVRKCSAEWNAYSWKVGALVKAEDVRTMHMRVFERVPLLNALRPWYEAFFDNVNEFSDMVLPKLACAADWDAVDRLQQCVADIAHAFMVFVEHVEASEKKDLENDLASGWSEDHAFLSQRPATTMTMDHDAPVSTMAANHDAPVVTMAIDNDAPVRTLVLPPEPTAIATSYPTSADTLVDAASNPSASGHHSSWWSVTWKVLLSGAFVAMLAFAVVRVQRFRASQGASGFRLLPQKERDEDAEAQTLLNEFSDTDDEDMLDL